MLASLIQMLEKVEYKLMKIKTEGSLTGYFLPQERCRSLTKMVNILGSLVNRTTHNKNHQDDIALCQNKSDITNSESEFPNLISSEEFLKEVQYVIKSIPSSNCEIHTYLSSFQELLGDIIFSICEINNCQMKLASGIKVKDLILMKNLYSSFWELLSSLFYPKSFTASNPRKLQRKTRQPSSEANMNVSDLVTAVQSCLKEMSKVKLEIEHYIKFNLIEMQFNKSENENKLIGSDVTEDKVKNNNTAEYLNPEDDIFADNEVNRSSSDLLAQEFFLKHGSRQKQTLHNLAPMQAESQENYLGSYVLPPKVGGWDNCYDHKFVEDAYCNFFKAPVIYPPDVLFFDPPTVVFKSQVEPTPKHSLPRIYSLDSVSDKPTVGNDENIKNSSNNVEQTKVIPPFDNNNKQENFIKRSLFENTDGDLFSDSQDNKGSEAEYVQLKEKISSLFNMLRTNQINDKEDIFDMNHLQPHKRESSCSPQPKTKKPEIKAKKKKIKKDKHSNRNVTSHLQNENKEKPGAEVRRIKHRILHAQNTSKKEKYIDFKRERPKESWSPNKSEVIYDENSVIQLFKTNPIKCFNSESAPTEESTFCLWPVAANYIYVSKGSRVGNCHSVSSNNSISLSKGFEKSFFSLHLNKKYEQKQLYDGDLIVLNRTESLQNKNSNYLMCDKSTVVYDESETSENGDIKHLYRRDYNGMANRRKSQMIPFNKPFVPVEHGGPHPHQQTYAVHFADCEDSFMVNKNYKKEKLDYFNYNRYDDAQNWDSFISIVASKIGPNTHINERRMFRKKIVKNLGAESLTDNNIFGNVQTLTSNGGPFRLFDINGYPLTDSAGNVLKDPYGKGVVELDSTGFPKDNIKVFDAAGNSPKDLNFDPTQKPQTNCIVVKLTDNFKRPLHLFDKYGRPLTDANGKLLVNVHGRPLLRFDNFGRPNTDYRGGPLYTDNGLRWSYKTGQSFSKEKLSNDTLTLKNFNSEYVSAGDTSVSTDVTDKTFMYENNGHCDSKQDHHVYTDSKSSDIWLRVETVLQHHSMKTKLGERHSQTKVIVNSVTVKQNSDVKEFLSPIIYHDDRITDCTNKYGRNDLQKDQCAREGVDRKVKDDTIKEYNNFLKDKVKFGVEQDLLNSNIKASIPSPLYKDVLIKTTRSHYYTNANLSQKQPNDRMPTVLIEKNDNCKPPQLFLNEDVLTKRLFDISMCHPNSKANNIPSIFTLDNHDYLNNLCNKILKNKMESRAKLKVKNTRLSEMRSVFNPKKDHFIETTLSDFTSSIASKYTNDVPLYTDSPVASYESQKIDPQITKILEDIDLKFKKHDEVVNGSSKRKDLKHQKDDIEVTSENNNYKTDIQKGNQNKNRYEEYPNKDFELTRPSEETTTFIDISSNGDKLYQINVQERIRAGLQSCDDHFMYSDSSGIPNEKEYPEKETKIIKQNKNIPDRPTQHFSRPMKHETGLYHGEYCRHFKNENNKTKDSPFRFPSDERMETTIAMNNEVNYINKKTCLGQDKFRMNQKYFDNKHSVNKTEYFYPNKAKKPGRNYRDCNLVSFLGTPVKYVWNKLDTKLSKQHGKNKNHNHLKTIYEPYEGDRKMKTLYHNSKSNKKDITSTETEETHIESKRRQKHKQKGQITSFKSKSYSDVLGSKIGNMTYSGSQDTSDKFSPENSSQYKCSSDTAVMSSHKHAYPQRRSRKLKPKNEQYSFETHHVHTRHTTHHHRRSSEKSPKNYKKQSSKSPKSRSHTVKLFKKSGHSGRKKRVR